MDMIFTTIRRDVDLTDIHESLANLDDIPIELALPYKLRDFVETIDRLDELEAYVRDNRIKVFGIHAAQGRITSDDFLKWAVHTQQFARATNARYVVYHPDRVGKTRRLNEQIVARQHLKDLERTVPGVQICIESFGGRDRLFTPEEIIGSPWPLVLDLSHLDPDRSYRLIEDHHYRILVIHVSEVAKDSDGSTKSHMPAGPVCGRAFKLLKEHKWRGLLTLEYLHEFQDQMFADRTRIESEFRVFPDD